MSAVAEPATPRGLCSVGGCGRAVRSRGWCAVHYRRWQVHGDPLVCLKPRVASVSGETCEVADCGKPVRARSLCQYHYNRAWAGMDPVPAPVGHRAGVVCAAGACENNAAVRGYCPRHYQRLMKYGHPLAGPAFRRRRGTGLPRWAYWQRRSEQRQAADADLLAYVEILRSDPCSYCGSSMEQVDHIVPFNEGGALVVENVTAACRRCNVRKHATSLLRFLLLSAGGGDAE